MDFQIHFLSFDIIDLRILVTTVLDAYQGQILFHRKRLRPQRSCLCGEAGLVSLLVKERRLSFPSFSYSSLLCSTSLLLLILLLSPFLSFFICFSLLLSFIFSYSL